MRWKNMHLHSIISPKFCQGPSLNRRVIELREIVNIYKEDVNEKGKWAGCVIRSMVFPTRIFLIFRNYVKNLNETIKENCLKVCYYV